MVKPARKFFLTVGQFAWCPGFNKAPVTDIR